MKKTIAIFIILFVSLGGYSQEPLKWNYSNKKINDSTYTIHFTATIDNGWHGYSQIQPESAVAMPTSIKFSENPLIKIKGKMKEVGLLIKWIDPTTGISANEYSEKVDFVQTIILKAKVKTNISGTITFQTCTDQMCLPPKTIPFSITIP